MLHLRKRSEPNQAFFEWVGGGGGGLVQHWSADIESKLHLQWQHKLNCDFRSCYICVHAVYRNIVITCNYVKKLPYIFPKCSMKIKKFIFITGYWPQCSKLAKKPSTTAKEYDKNLFNMSHSVRALVETRADGCRPTSFTPSTTFETISIQHTQGGLHMLNIIFSFSHSCV